MGKSQSKKAGCPEKSNPMAKLIDFLPLVRNILQIIAATRRKKRKRRILRTIDELLGFVQEYDTWKSAINRLWKLTEANMLPSKVRGPNDVKQWLFTTIAVLEKVAEQNDDPQRLLADDRSAGPADSTSPSESC